MASATSSGAARARTALQALLRWTSLADSPWTGSTLSIPGFPLELAFSSAGRAVRYCVEVADPASDPQGRLATAINLLSQMSPTATETSIFEFLRTLQRSGGLKYGAWIGGRHSEGGDRYKLYAEVPVAAMHIAETCYTELSGVIEHTSPQSRIEMIGYDPAARRIEFYRRGRNLTPSSIRAVMRQLRLESRAEDLFGLLQRAYRFPLAGRLPSSDCGYSVSLSPDGSPPIFSLYFFARSMFGGDGNTRATILRLATERNWDLADYESVSEPLDGVTGAVTRHGMFGLTIGSNAPLTVSLGLVPPSAVTRTDQWEDLHSSIVASSNLCPASR